MLWIVLAAMTIVALATVLWPLAFARRRADRGDSEAAFYQAQLAEIDRDIERGILPPTEASSARAETARRLLALGGAGSATRPQGRLAEGSARTRRRLAAVAGVVMVPVIGGGLYALYGHPDLANAAPAAVPQTAAPEAQDPVVAAVAHIESELATSTDNVKAWSALAPVYLRLGRYPDAVTAYRNLIRLQGAEAQLLANLGEAEVAAAGGTVTPEARRDFDKALAKSPDLAMAKYYLGLAAEQAGDKPQAIATYESLLGKIDDHPTWKEIIAAKLASLKGEPPPAPPVPDVPADPSAAPAATGPVQPDMIEGMVARLAGRIEKQGGSADEWLKLIRAYSVLQKTDKAEAALVSARKALAGDPKATSDLTAIAQEFHLGGQ